MSIPFIGKKSKKNNSTKYDAILAVSVLAFMTVAMIISAVSDKKQ